MFIHVMPSFIQSSPKCYLVSVLVSLMLLFIYYGYSVGLKYIITIPTILCKLQQLNWSFIDVKKITYNIK